MVCVFVVVRIRVSRTISRNCGMAATMAILGSEVGPSNGLSNGSSGGTWAGSMLDADLLGLLTQIHFDEIGSDSLRDGSSDRTPLETTDG